MYFPNNVARMIFFCYNKMHYQNKFAMQNMGVMLMNDFELESEY